ncbi:septal ring lytic transglycosylase RlpA family protein [Flavobacterium sediminilitoris]|uniref:Probable endolytic peptidoglycan transglycosylase RlpA n=1 Tax=Flavobacterium sediminilitoris TaxID=2024526 RepID=A0ABY4HS88_9FLAO|nr:MULTISPECIES: septal ring lytic transglycosylase RlpA family protein [Flavobacterium]UOX35071.1 septal ring lytic transglycosylase RlpA family protein [Flavobacterium sediminilitoris]
MKFSTKIICSLFLLVFASSFTSKKTGIFTNRNVFFDSIKKDTILVDSISLDSSLVIKSFKESVHASYYHDKFNGRRTASGQKFNNNLYTAAHKKLKFGTKVKVTNTVNGKSVIVVINDRGPFIKGREIDLSKKAFMEIAKNKKRGYLIVDLEIIEE